MNGLIEERVFSLYLQDEANFRNASMFTAGGYDLERFAPGKNITWNENTDPDYWSLKLKKAQIGDTMVITGTNHAIIDSGTSYLAMPESALKSLTSLLDTVYGYQCEFDDYNYLYACACPDLELFKSTFPSLKVTLSESNTYEIPASDFVEREDGYCFLLINKLSSDANFWILGDIFLR